MKKIVLTLLLIFFAIANRSLSGADMPDGDTIFIKELQELPVIDGYSDDTCWNALSWHAIDQVWMPWGEKVDSADFFGRYKIGWSSGTNLLYILLEIHDDVISDAYCPGKTAEIYNFDMFEIFIDEDRSGGLHVFDGGGTADSVFGLNAENAFAYHICTRFPENGEGDPQYFFEDLAGTCWDSVETRNYADHFPEFTSQHNDQFMHWELSLKVFSDDYDNTDPAKSRVILHDGKIMGFSMAYNDNDKPDTDPKNARRENFIGSVAVSEDAWNDHWKNADDFAPAKLVGPDKSLARQGLASCK